VEGWVDLSTTVKVHSPCSRLYIVAAVAINTTVSGVIRTWILSQPQSDALTTRPLRPASQFYTSTLGLSPINRRLIDLNIVVDRQKFCCQFSEKTKRDRQIVTDRTLPLFEVSYVSFVRSQRLWHLMILRKYVQTSIGRTKYLLPKYPLNSYFLLQTSTTQQIPCYCGRLD